jgi:hypothetical protein
MQIVNFFDNLHYPIRADRMIPRLAAPRLVELASYYPIVAITGPRQSGKTTLARATFPDQPYASLWLARHRPRHGSRVRLTLSGQAYSGWKACSGLATGPSPLQYGESFLSLAITGGTAAMTRSTSSSVL